MKLEDIIYQAAADGIINEWQADELTNRINKTAKAAVDVQLGARCFIQEANGWELGKLARSRDDGGLFRIGGITLALLFFALSAFGQDLKPRLNLPVEYRMEKRDLVLFGVGNGLALISGMAYGVREVVQHKPNRIPADWNRDWWDSRESWKNKYQEGNPDNERRLMPVMFTDAYHLSGTVHRWTATCSGICIGLNSNNNWRQIGMNALISAAFFQIGFRAAYNTDLIFH